MIISCGRLEGIASQPPVVTFFFLQVQLMRVVWVLLLFASTLPADDRSPNVILILADDLAMGDLSSENGDRSRTPSLERLRGESVVCSQGYSASCVCAPARAALLTGRYPHRTGVVTLNMNRHPGLTRLRHDETTIAELFQAAGYRTGLVGKWHCGGGKGQGPLTHGFDEFEGFSGSADLSYFRYPLIINDRVQMVSDRYLTDHLSDRAIEFVRRHRERPFFLHLAHYAPHRPLEAPAPLIDFYRQRGEDENTATIYAMIEVMDRGIGRLLDELQRLKLDQQTIVVFASDNGPDPLTGVRFNGELRGTKYQVQEGGIRVPLWFRWPGHLNARSVNQPVHFIDIAPTLLQLCELNRTAPFDGRSVAPMLRTGRSIPSRELFWQWNRGRPNYTHNAAIRRGPWKLVRPYVNRKTNPDDSSAPLQLFNLSADPSESHNAIDQHLPLAKQMKDALADWSEAVEQSRLRPAAAE